MTRPHPWLTEAHDLGPTTRTARRLRARIYWRLRRWWRCEYCHRWRRDPTAHCTGCGL